MTKEEHDNIDWVYAIHGIKKGRRRRFQCKRKRKINLLLLVSQRTISSHHHYLKIQSSVQKLLSALAFQLRFLQQFVLKVWVYLLDKQ